MSLNATAGPARFFISHWRGNHGLAFTILVTLLGLRLSLGYLQLLVPASPALVLIGFCILANVLLLVWQVVGAFRAGDRHLRATGDMMPVWGSYFAIFVVVVLASIQTVDAITTLSPAPPRVADARVLPDLPISADGETITLSGNIDFDLNTALVEALATHPAIRRVTLSSGGGYIFAARAVAFNIGRHRLDTHVDGSCNSACTLAFMAGDARTLGPEARLGFHRYQMETPDKVQILNIGEEMEKDRSYFASRGVSDGFLDEVFQAGHGDIWFPSRAVLLEAGVINDR
jgi:hypothetical protein